MAVITLYAESRLQVQYTAGDTRVLHILHGEIISVEIRLRGMRTKAGYIFPALDQTLRLQMFRPDSLAQVQVPEEEISDMEDTVDQRLVQDLSEITLSEIRREETEEVHLEVLDPTGMVVEDR